MRLDLPPDEYYKQLAKVPTSGGAIFRNKQGEFLILKQTYKDGWHIAGGVADEHETPREAAIREVREELGISIADRNIHAFCVDFAKNKPFDRILFLFDCGILDNTEIGNIKLDLDEISEYKFVPEKELFSLLAPMIGKRLSNSIQAMKNGACIYLEDGELPK